MNNISIDAEAVKAIVAKGIVESLPEATRDSIIAQAVEWLVTTPTGSYGRVASPSPLQVAFNRALADAATEVVSEMVATGDLRERLRTMVTEKVAEALVSDTVMTDAVGSAVGEAVTKVLRSQDSPF